MEVKINNEWYDLSDFDSYEELEALGEIQDADGIPNVVDLKADWDNIQEYLSQSENDQQIVMAYYEATDSFDPKEALEAYVGNFVSGAEFADSMAYELGYIPKDLPSWIATHIDWQAVWDAELSHDYFAYDDHYFRNM